MYELSFDPQDVFVPLTDEISLATRVTNQSHIFVPVEMKVVSSGWVRAIQVQKIGGSYEKYQGLIDLHWRFQNDILTFKVKVRFFTAIDSVVFLLKGIPCHSIQYVALNGEKEIGDYHFVRGWIPPINYPRFAKMPIWFITDKQKEHKTYIHWQLKHVNSVSLGAYYDSRQKDCLIITAYHLSKRLHTSEINIPTVEIGMSKEPMYAIARRLKMLEENKILTPYDHRTDKPSWLDQIRLIVFLHGQHWSGFVHNNFSSMTKAIEALKEDMHTQSVLFLLLGWDGPYYKTDIRLWPAEELGGEKGFKELINEVKGIQGKVVLFTPLNTISYDYASTKGWLEGALHRPWKAKAWCDWTDWDYDLEQEPLLFMNLDYPPFRKFLYRRYEKLIKSFDIDGFYLDITNYWENDPFFDHLEGLKKLIQFLRSLQNNILIAAENWYDHLLGLFPLFGEPGNEMGPGDLLLRYSRNTPYIACPDPSGSGGVHNKGYNYLGASRLKKKNIPYISITNQWRKYLFDLKQNVRRSMIWDPRNSKPDSMLGQYLEHI